MENKDITSWGDHCFITNENSVKEDDVRIFHPMGRSEHKGILVFAFMIHRRFRKDMVTWCFVKRDDFDSSIMG